MHNKQGGQARSGRPGAGAPLALAWQITAATSAAGRGSGCWTGASIAGHRPGMARPRLTP